MDLIAQHQLDKASQIYYCVVKSVNNNQCTIVFNNKQYTVPYYGGKPIPNKTYAIFIPHNNMNESFVIGEVGDVANEDIVPISKGGTDATNQTGAAFNLGAFDLYLGTEIPENANMNTYSTPGTYFCPTAARASTLTNSPHNNAAFKMVVMRTASTARYCQIAILNDAIPTIYKRYYNGAWSSWIKTLDESRFPFSLEEGGTDATTQTAAALNLGALDLYEGTVIPNGADLNDYKTPGVYYSNASTNSATMVNPPATGAGFKLIVGRVTQATNRIFQIAIYNAGAPTIWKRYFNTNTWTTWAQQVDSTMLPLSLENGGTGIAASTPIAAINALGGRTFYYENIASSNTVTITTTGLAGVALFFGGSSATRVGAYIAYFPNSTSNPIIVPMAEASAITITPSAGMITITAGVQLYMSVMCLYEATAARLTITKT